MKNLLLIFLFSFSFLITKAQTDRAQVIEQKLNDLAKSNPGLEENVDFSVSGATLGEFLKGLAESHNLNISIDPSLNFRVNNNFNNEKVKNVILFLVIQYDLDISFVGSIMYFRKFEPPIAEKPLFVPKNIIVKYNGYNNTLSLDLKNDTLEKVVKRITQVSKKNVILSSGLNEKLVSVYIEDMPFDNALQKMAFSNDLKVIKTEDDFYVMRSILEDEKILADKNESKSKNKKPVKKATIGTQAGETSLQFFTEKDSLGVVRISLDAINVSISEVIKNISEEADINYFLLSDIKGNISTHFSNLTADEIFSFLLQGTQYTFKKENGIYLFGERRLEGLRAYKVIQFQYRSLTDILPIIPADIQKGVEIKEFKELNSILLTGASPEIFEIERFVKELDRVVPLVMIEVIIVDVRKGRSVKTGIKAGLSDSVRSGGTILPGIDFTWSSGAINDFLGRIGFNNALNLGKVSPNFYVGLSALESNNNIEVRSTPKLSTLNGHLANLSIGSKRYYSIRTQNITGTLTPTTLVTEQFNAVEANLSINIRPIVSGDDQVTLEIDVSISDFLGEPVSNAPPPSSLSQFKSIVRVKNEEMVVLGGLERVEKSDDGTGIPFLSRIPVLKWLFSSRTKAKNRVVSIVFIKPTIIY